MHVLLVFKLVFKLGTIYTADRWEKLLYKLLSGVNVLISTRAKRPSILSSRLEVACRALDEKPFHRRATWSRGINNHLHHYRYVSVIRFSVIALLTDPVWHCPDVAVFLRYV